MEGVYQEGTYFSLGSNPVTLYFTSDSIWPFRGFRLYFYVGEGSPGNISNLKLGNESEINRAKQY